jgi:DNA-binding SARP family transcriptional activator/Flp pilus assembly protein TadD
MEFKILGPLEVRAGDREVTCKSSKQRLLLSLLLLNANEVVSSDRLTDLLWGDDPPETSKALQMHVSQLRKTLEPGVLVTRAPGYELRVGPRDVDAQRFEDAVEEGRSELAAGRPRDARRILREGLSLWRGPPLADLMFEESLQRDIARLEELRLSAIEARIDADLALGNHAEAIAELEALASEHPTRERIHAQFMLALYRSGRQAEALEAYRDTRRALVEELGIEPGRELQELEGRILAQDPELDLAPPAPERSERLLGREHDLAELLPVVDAALDGRGGLVLVGGEPGIGKSRLAEALAARARDREARVLVGRCWEAGGAPAYWPWVQAMRGHVGDLLELRDLLPADAPDDESEGARFRLFEAVGSTLSQAAPVAVFLDDVHAADSPSLLLLRFMTAQLTGARVLICCCYRDTEAAPDLVATLVELGRDPVTHRVTLTGLDERATEHLLEETMGSSPAADLLAKVQDGTRGNPLFVAELGRLLAAGEWRDGRLPIPEGVRETIGHRLERRSPGCRAMLDAASAFGREFELQPLGQVCGLDEDELFAAIDEATAARFVGDVPGATGRLRFAHVLMRDALYEQLPATRRMRLHREIAAVLEGRYARSLDRHASELAHHYLLGGNSVAEQAIAYATRAGDHAASQHAHEEAVRHYASALTVHETTGTDDPRRTCELLLALGDEQSRAGDTVAAKEPFQRAAEIADRERWPDLLSRAALGYGGRFAWGRASVDPGLVPLLERALAAVGDHDSPERVRLLGRLAAARRDESFREPRVRLAEEALAMARRIGDPETIAYALEAHWPAVEGPATLDGRLERANQLIALGHQTNDLERVFVGHDYRHNTFVTLADRAGVDVDIAAMRELAQRLRQPAQLWSITTSRAMLALLEGRFADAEILIDEAHELGEESYRFNADVSYRVQLFLLRRAQGRLAEVQDTIAQAVHQYPAFHRFTCVLAHVHAELGHEREARAAFAAAMAHDLSREYVDEEYLFALNTLVDACAYLRDDEAATSLYDLMLPYERLYAEAPVEGTFGAMARGLGVLATQLRRFDDAERHYKIAIEIERAMRARPWIAHAQHGLGELLLARGDDPQARRVLDEAVAGYRELGMESWAERAAAL